MISKCRVLMMAEIAAHHGRHFRRQLTGRISVINCTTSKKIQLAIFHFKRKPYWNFKALSWIDLSNQLAYPLASVESMGFAFEKQVEREVTQGPRSLSNVLLKVQENSVWRSCSWVLENLMGMWMRHNANDQVYNQIISNLPLQSPCDMWLKSCKIWPKNKIKQYKTNIFDMSPCLHVNNSLAIPWLPFGISPPRLGWLAKPWPAASCEEFAQFATDSNHEIIGNPMQG